MPSGIKVFDTDFRSKAASGRLAAISPDEIDAPYEYKIDNPSIGGAFYYNGTLTAGSTVTTGLLANIADYPRNVLFSFPGGTTAGTVTVFGKDQFGYKTSEAIGGGTAAAGGTVAGTKIFASVGSAVIVVANANTGTYSLGLASGTTAGIKHLFGLPTKIAGTQDVWSINYINSTTINAYQTPWSAVAGSPNHTFAGTAVVATTDHYIIRLNPSWDNSSQVPYLMNMNNQGSAFG